MSFLFKGLAEDHHRYRSVFRALLISIASEMVQTKRLSIDFADFSICFESIGTRVIQSFACTKVANFKVFDLATSKYFS